MQKYFHFYIGLFTVVLVVASAFFAKTLFAATTIGTNLSTDGIFTAGGQAIFNGAVTIGNDSTDTITIQAAPTFFLLMLILR